jgi:hypothetical protein
MRGLGALRKRSSYRENDHVISDPSVAIGQASDPAVQEPLKQLLALTQSLAARLPDDATKQSVANKMKALAKEATALKPDHSMLKVTAQGLVDAAIFVADMAAPIAKAVGIADVILLPPSPALAERGSAMQAAMPRIPLTKVVLTYYPFSEVTVDGE